MIPALLLFAAASDIERAFERMYNFDFAGAHDALAGAILEEPEDPLPYSARSAAHLFSELDRLGILESEFFADNKRITSKKRRVSPDAAVRAKLQADVAKAQDLAGAKLAVDPDDANALFAMSMSWGISADYAALVEKRHLGSLSIAKKSNHYANLLRKTRPEYYDALLTTGLSEYIIASLPFFVRWFVKFDDVEGSKQRGIEQLEVVAQRGNLYKPFAKILLAIVHVREKRHAEAYALLDSLSREFPENPLLRTEAARLLERVEGGGR
jgi:hypothetical protein